MSCFQSTQTYQQYFKDLIDEDSLHLIFDSEKGLVGSEIFGGLARCGQQAFAFYSIDSSNNFGFISSVGAQRILRIMDKAEELGIPLLCFLASAGVSIEEGLKSGNEYSRVFTKHIHLSGKIPQHAIVTGPCMGASSYSATLMDFIYFSKARSHLMVSSPAVVNRVLGENRATLASLGGAQLHSETTGIAHFLAKNPKVLCQILKKNLQFFPGNFVESPKQRIEMSPEYDNIEIPSEAHAPFDMEMFLKGIVDKAFWTPYSENYAPSMLCAWAYLGGHPVGILANNSLAGGGAIDSDAAQKSERFIRACDAYSIPLLNFIDVPGYLPGEEQEEKAILRTGAAMCKAMSTRVAKIAVVVRRCFGAAGYVQLQGPAQNGDMVFALKNSRIAIMGFEAAKDIVYTKEEKPCPEKYYRDYEDPIHAQKLGMIDKIVEKEALRIELIRHLGFLKSRRDNFEATYHRGVQA